MAGPAGVLTALPRAALAALLLVVPACERDDEAALRAEMQRWFYLGNTVYFRSQKRCTAAMIHVGVERTRPGVEVEDDPGSAMEAFRTRRFAAVRMAGVTPEQITDAMLLTASGTFGKEALAAGSLAAPCIKGTNASGYLHEAMRRPGALMAYDRETGGLMILDPARLMLFYIGGDVW